MQHNSLQPSLASASFVFVFVIPPFFLIVILVVVKGAGLTSRGDGRASDSTEVYIYKGHRE